ncbi:hypothetical protein F5Y00DRAFT_273178 [Daldinia vernicosa]|uniref:uncharacterized protein n=1 Tax=Daldinia vernicosa TaxID=114800 RepID=UPI00200776E2|nr:uncharacterized protein F5Y00DRAFT_273178 [Daldinia vernicosa]KAI0852607.1 hypothetical protein F5Y00DRAFT_273178 [Daldinia vernicosa]
MASTSYSHHPLPTPPQQGQYRDESYQQQVPVPPHHYYQQQQQQQQQQQLRQQQRQQPVIPVKPSEPQKPERVRPKSRAFSFRSDKSHRSSNSHNKNNNNAHETSAEKEANRLHGKTDPTLAMTELEPSMEAQSKGGINPASLRSFQHKDIYGNPITDPDRSNPTRSRSERPLDTIRAFEAAIDGAYSRQSDTASVANFSRRGSYYGSEQYISPSPSPNYVYTISQKTPLDNGPRFPQDSYYGGRPNSGFRPESTMYDPRQAVINHRESYHEGYENAPYGHGNPGPRNRYSRMQSDPYANPRVVVDKNVYPMPNNHRSYETVASGSGSGSLAEPAGYQTDPTSSDNSSIDRRSPPKRQEPVNDYGISFGQATQTPNLGLAPPNPRKENGILRKPSKAAAPSGHSEERPQSEKRKSWFKRFGKS